MKRKKMKGLVSLKEARQKTRAISGYFSIPTYFETDGSYSVKFPNGQRAVFCVAVDKSDTKYHIDKVHDVRTGRVRPGYVRAWRSILWCVGRTGRVTALSRRNLRAQIPYASPARKRCKLYCRK